MDLPPITIDGVVNSNSTPPNTVWVKRPNCWQSNFSWGHNCIPWPPMGVSNTPLHDHSVDMGSPMSTRCIAIPVSASYGVIVERSLSFPACPNKPNNRHRNRPPTPTTPRCNKQPHLKEFHLPSTIRKTWDLYIHTQRTHPFLPFAHSSPSHLSLATTVEWLFPSDDYCTYHFVPSSPARTHTHPTEHTFDAQTSHDEQRSAPFPMGARPFYYCPYIQRCFSTHWLDDDLCTTTGSVPPLVHNQTLKKPKPTPLHQNDSTRFPSPFARFALLLSKTQLPPIASTI